MWTVCVSECVCVSAGERCHVPQMKWRECVLFANCFKYTQKSFTSATVQQYTNPIWFGSASAANTFSGWFKGKIQRAYAYRRIGVWMSHHHTYTAHTAVSNALWCEQQRFRYYTFSLTCCVAFGWFECIGCLFCILFSPSTANNRMRATRLKCVSGPHLKHPSTWIIINKRVELPGES